MAASGVAIAQAPPTPATPRGPDRVAGAGRRLRADAIGAARAPWRPPGTTTGQRPEPLGDKLAKSDGVLCPPSGVDPEMRAPTPDAGNMPVIPPPGSPGGDPIDPAEITAFPDTCRIVGRASGFA